MKASAVPLLERLWGLEDDTSKVIESEVETWIESNDPDRREYCWVWFAKGLMTRKVPKEFGGLEALPRAEEDLEC